MSLMKWMRKNNKKLMAVVVIVLMIAFVGGSALSFLLRPTGGIGDTVAYYGARQRITHRDRMIADQEIRLLEELGASDLLRAQDLRGLLLAELLFPQSRGAVGALDMARQTIQRNQLRISEKQLSEMYQMRTVPNDIYWFLLSEEARSAGIHIPNEEVGDLLGRIVPQLFEGRTYSEMMRFWVSRHALPEQNILTVFGRLLAVLQHAQVVSSMQNITTSQIRHIASREGETLDTEYVRFEAAAFADEQQAPSEDAMTEHFDRFKANFTGDVSEANPFGFGYRLPNRVQFDYIALRLPDVTAITNLPTEEDAMQYYQQNRARQFTDRVPLDPSDPDSPQMDQVRPYIEVADEIMRELRRQRITTRAEQILQEARTLADARLPRTDPDGEEPTIEQRREGAGDYGRIGQDLSSKYSIPLYSGQTGLLSAIDIRNDRRLRRMYLMGAGHTPVHLSQFLFSVNEFGDSATILLGMQRAEMYASAGPVRDPMSASVADLTDQIMLIVRVVAAEPDAAPAGLDVTYSTRTLDLGDAPEPQDQTFSVREQVEKDLRMLAAWDTAGTRAEEFLALALEEGWDAAVDRFNELYGEQVKADPADPDAFRLDRRMSAQRISNADLEVLAAQLANSPVAKIYMNEAQVESRLIDRLYSLASADPETPAQVPVVMEFQPGRSYYAVRSALLQPVHKEQFQQMKGMVIGREDYSQSQSMAVVHLNPQNILTRMNFRFADEPEPQTAAGTSEESKEAS